MPFTGAAQAEKQHEKKLNNTQFSCKSKEEKSGMPYFLAFSAKMDYNISAEFDKNREISYWRPALPEGGFL